MRTALVVVNPAAGAGRAPQQARALTRELEAAGFAAQTVLTAPTVDVSLVEKLSRADVAIAVGGDGTLNRVANAILQIEERMQRPTLGFLACGTGNAATRAFGLPRRPGDVAALAHTASTLTIDVGVVSRDGSQVGVFLLWAGAGVDASLIEGTARSRASYRGWRLTAEYMRQAARMLLTYRFPVIEATGDVGPGTFGAVMAANVGHLAIGSITAHADPTDGLLNIVATQPRHRAEWMAAALLSSIHLYDRCPRVSRGLGAALRLESSERVPIHVDGEPIGTLPVEITVLPGSIRLLVNPPRTA